jgi:hypothetical protein
LAAVDSTGALPSRRLKEHRTAARNMAVAADSIDVRTIANILHTYMRMYLYIYIISLSLYIYTISLSLYIYIDGLYIHNIYIDNIYIYT